MKQNRKARHRRTEAGIALLIAIFVLLLVCIVGIALIVSSGTETALGANYRSSTNVYYAALAGLEEARGRLSTKNPDYLNVANPGFFPSPGTPVAIGNAYYITNPVAGEDVLALYPDYPNGEYKSEFGVDPTNVYRAASVSNNNTQGIPGPLFKWVRINAATEQSLNLDVDNDGQPNDNTIPLYYDPAHVDGSGNPQPSLIVSAAPPSTAVQALEITSLAVLPNGSQKLLQYIVAPTSLSLVFPAALTMDGYSDVYAGPNHNFFQILGNNASGNSACGGTPYPVPAIGVPDSPDVTNVNSGIPTSPDETVNYQGTGPTPNVVPVGLAPNFQTVQSLNQLVQIIVENADAVIAGPADQTKLPSTMSSTNPMIIAIQGDPTVPSQGNLTLSGPFTGYGLLLVTGSLSYDPAINWNGIILVIGQGTVTSFNGGSGGLFSGAMLIAQTRNSSGIPLTGPNPGPATFNDAGTSGGVGQGIFYNCSWIQAAQTRLSYKVLSFHEIPQ